MKARLNAFKYAFQGFATLVRTQPHAKFHLLATLGVVVLGFICRLPREEWALVFVALGLVWITEAVNTAIEFLADEVTLERRERIKHAKDIAAFAVLASALAAASIGVIIFVPRIRLLLH